MRRSRLPASALLAALATAPLAGQELSLRRTLLATAGTVDGFSALTFGEIGDVGFDARGRLHVLDPQAGHVVVIDTTGVLLHVVGRRGEGPGEFRLPNELHVFPDGTLAVLDFGRGLVLLDADGTERGTLRLTDDGYNQARAVTSDGEIVSWDTVEGLLLAGGAGPRRVVRGAPQDPGAWRVVHRAPMPALTGPDGRVGGALWSGGLPGLVDFVAELRVAPLPGGGLAVADTTTYRVTLLSADGTTTARITRNQAPRPVTEDLRDEARRSILEALDRAAPGAVMSLDDGRTVPAQGYARQIQRQRAEVMRFGTAVPVIRDLAADADGRIWIQRETPSGSGRAVDVFDAGGALLGTLADAPERLPDAFGPGGLAAWVVVDGFGVPRVRIERIEVGLGPNG